MNARVAILFAATVLPAELPAHPHARVDQQAHLSIGRTQTVVTYYLAASSRDGGHMFGHLDGNSDGRLSVTEQAAFARALVNQSRLTVDGVRRALTVTHFAFPDRTAMAAGGGVLRVRARAPVALGSATAHRLTLNVTHDRFARNWFVQPLYGSDLRLANRTPILRRVRGSNMVEIRIPQSPSHRGV